MATESITALRRFAGFVITMLFLGVYLCVGAAGQSAAPPTVLSNTTAAPFNAATQNGVSFSGVWNIAISQQGDIIVEDFAVGSLYQIPADGRPVITITSGGLGAWNAMGVAIDPNNNVIIGCNGWNGNACLIPYNATTRTWDYSQVINWGTATWTHMDAEATNASGVLAFGNENGTVLTVPLNTVINGAGGTFSTVVTKTVQRVLMIAIDDVGDIAWVENTGGGNPPGTNVFWISAATAALGTATDKTALDISTTNGSSAVSAPKGTAANGVAIDAAGNVYVADANIGVYVVPNENGVPNPAHSYLISNVPAVNGLAIDRVHGTLIVPTTQTSTAKSMWENAGYYAVIKYGAGDVGSFAVGGSQVTSYTMPDWGQYPAGSTSVWYNFLGSVSPAQFVFQEEGVLPTQDFQSVNLSPPSGSFKIPQCALGTQYKAGDSCFVQAALNPQASGSISAQLLMQTEQAVSSGDADYSATITGYSGSNGILTLTAANGFLPYELVNFAASTSGALAALNGKSVAVLGNGLSGTSFEIQTPLVTGSGADSKDHPLGTTATGVYTYTAVASTTLHGTGLGANVNVTPAMESTAGSGLKVPGEPAVDALGNIYVADAGQSKVVEFAAGSGAQVKVGSGFTAPSGVAVDGTGNVFVADNGNVYEIPLWSVAAPVQIATGLGANLSLAVDGLGDLYVADPSNGRVVRMWNLGASGSGLLAQSVVSLTGFTAPAAVAVDSSNNLYVADGANLFEISPSGTSTLLSNLSNVTGLAVDASGAVYVASAGGTWRYSSLGGTLNSSGTAIAPTVANPTGVAIDRLGNVYLSDATALNIHEVQTSAMLDLGVLPTTTSTNTLSATVINTGNSPLTVTGYTATKAPSATATSYFPPEYDYFPTDVNCEASAIAAGDNCTVNVEFNPGPGDQGTLTSFVTIKDNATNGKAGINTTGVGAPLASSSVTFTVASGSEVINTTVNVTVKATSGSEMPTGEVTVYYPSPTTALTTDAKHNPINQTLTRTLTLDSSGTASFTLAPVAAGNTSFTVSYQGDRTFGKATLTATGTVAKSNVQGMILPTADSIPQYVLENASASGNNSYPYDGKEGAWVYSLPAQVTAKVGTPTGILEYLDSGSVACPASSGAGTPYLDASGSASLNLGCLPMPANLTYTAIISSHVITLSYAGDLNYNGFTYPTSFTFTAVRSPAVLVTSVDGQPTTISSTDGSSSFATPITVSAGSSASAKLILTSVLGYGIAGYNQSLNNYSFPLSLTCENLPPHATCSFTYKIPDAALSTAFDISDCDVNGTGPDLPNPYQITGRSCLPAEATVTINTNVEVGTSTTSQNQQPAPFRTGTMLAAGLMGLFLSRKMRRGWRAMMTAMVCLFFLGAALIGSTACSTKNLTPVAVLTTPAGTYKVQVVALQVGTLVATASGQPVTIMGSQNPDSIPFTLTVTVQ